MKNSVFSLLNDKVYSTLLEIGLHEPTEPQAKAIPQILEGKNVLIVAPTGSGKTEAALLPVFSRFLEIGNKEGIMILYITPLRALNRDMLKRITEWANLLGLTVEVRHGDTATKVRRKQALKPPNMLLTTPETLQAILPGGLMRKHLSNVRFVIVDEIHELAEDKRGVQLTVALERLREITNSDFQRIGLSATVGNPKEVASFVAGTQRQMTVIEVNPPKSYVYNIEYPMPNQKDYDLAGDLNLAPEAAARIRRILDLIDNHVSTLVFVNSRTNAELLGHKLRQLSRDIAVHHGSLSREERMAIEDKFKDGILKALICTSTLELGIDVGNIELAIQYLSPRRVSSLIQRVGRSGHRLDRTSQGIIITAFPDDTLEAIASVRRAYRNLSEPIRFHDGALDVLAHQIIGILLDKGKVTVDEAYRIVKRAYPYRNLSKTSFLEVVKYLYTLRELWMEGDILGKTERTRRYYYENLSMIPDERRYPVIDVVSDHKIGVVGEEFMALRARIGLNFLCSGRVWRIVQIEDETGKVYVVPAEDPFASDPGWDGELLPLPIEIAEESGRLRQEIASELNETKDFEEALRNVAAKLSVAPEVVRDIVNEINEQLKRGFPVPTNNLILIEGYKNFVIVHSCFGETANVTLGCIFDAILSEHDLITGWWHDAYRILIETPRKVENRDLEKLPTILFSLDGEKVEKAFDEYLKAHFPFTERMKFIAQRFGALPRGKLAGPQTLFKLPQRFKDTPIYEETIREVLAERIDLSSVKKIMNSIKSGEIEVKTVLSHESPSPIGYHILAKYADVPELMASTQIIVNNIERMKKSIEARKVVLFCLSCGDWSLETRVRDIPEKPICGKCGNLLLACLRKQDEVEKIKRLLNRRVRKEHFTEEELKELSTTRREADLILSYGKTAVIALQVKGVGPETASRILGKMHVNEDDFYMDLLKAKIQFLKTRQYWDDKGVKA
ncbi:MAG: DEAD/DEAH box helicase [Candidatus Bathyarchaeia archaeon]